MPKYPRKPPESPPEMPELRPATAADIARMAVSAEDFGRHMGWLPPRPRGRPRKDGLPAGSGPRKH